MSEVKMQGYTLEDAKASVGKGWHKILEILFDAKPKNTIIVQVKEKYAGLRFYTSGTTEEYHDLINVAGWMSECICETCGQVGQVIRYGWWKTRCPKCQEEWKKAEE